jgi:hypothetical protein
MMDLDNNAKDAEDVYRLKLATYGADPERFAELAFPEWHSAHEITDVEDIRNIAGPVEYDLVSDEIMTPEKAAGIMASLGIAPS